MAADRLAEATLQRRMAELTARRNEDMALRDQLLHARRPVPFELGESLVPAIQWLMERSAEVDRLQSVITERDEQLAGLLHGTDFNFDEKAVPA
ncbi:hypothetical protein [Streptomyces sp. ISL-94]|uniref:hypothetical protein n=1 Tax=Streptomyces sp. ISL-94 TaxID=2819190 RepID=UPI001BE77099|nr:hypothetical protein [Streptomyces sp. ISL-94]MBT2477588.1 hypothetical protein [Streptomyces sp. ISL-94]